MARSSLVALVVYRVKKVAQIAGVTVKTLDYYYYALGSIKRSARTALCYIAVGCEAGCGLR